MEFTTFSASEVYFIKFFKVNSCTSILYKTATFDCMWSLYSNHPVCQQLGIQETNKLALVISLISYRH